MADAVQTKIPLRLHHHAYTTHDHEVTRHFYEDIVGLPLVAMYIEREKIGSEWLELGHAFYGLADGSALAFFNFADPEKQEQFAAKRQSVFSHLSLAVDRTTQENIAQRLQQERIEGSFSIDHGYCQSLYVTDPNGLLVEFTVDPPNVTEINKHMVSIAHAEMKRWIAGGRESNNVWRVEENIDETAQQSG